MNTFLLPTCGMAQKRKTSRVRSWAMYARQAGTCCKASVTKWFRHASAWALFLAWAKSPRERVGAYCVQTCVGGCVCEREEC